MIYDIGRNFHVGISKRETSKASIFDLNKNISRVDFSIAFFINYFTYTYFKYYALIIRDDLKRIIKNVRVIRADYNALISQYEDLNKELAETQVNLTSQT